MSKTKPAAKAAENPERKLRVRPMNDQVLVKRLPKEEKIGSLFIPDTAQEKRDRAEVVAVGPGAWPPGRTVGKRLPMGVKKGDRVLVGKYSGQTIELHGEELHFVREDDLIAREEA